MSDDVRLATRDDEDQIVQLLHVMHAENALLPLNETCAKKFFARAFDKQGGIIGVIGDPGDIRAILYLLITKWWYTDCYHLEEIFNFVRPDVRRSNHARTLIGFAKQCSDELKLPLVIGVLTNSRMEGKVRLYRRELGIPAGAFFVHGATWAEDAGHSSEDFWRTPFPTRVNGKIKQAAQGQ